MISSMNIVKIELFKMINSQYIYWFISALVVFLVSILLINFRSNKTPVNNKILLKNLLESLDLDLPDELKRLDNSSSDPQKL